MSVIPYSVGCCCWGDGPCGLLDGGLPACLDQRKHFELEIYNRN